MLLLNAFDLTASLNAVDNTNGSQSILCFIFPAVTILSLIWMAMKSSAPLAALCAAAIGFVLYSQGVSWYMSQPVMLHVAANAVLVAITFFTSERPARSMYV